MLNKASTLLRAATRVQAPARKMGGYGTPAHWRSNKQIAMDVRSHMDCLPVPEGSWKAHNSARNGKWNLMLISSLASVILTYGFLWSSGTLYFHTAPPMVNCKKNY